MAGIDRILDLRHAWLIQPRKYIYLQEFSFIYDDYPLKFILHLNTSLKYLLMTDPSLLLFLLAHCK